MSIDILFFLLLSVTRDCVYLTALFCGKFYYLRNFMVGIKNYPMPFPGTICCSIEPIQTSNSKVFNFYNISIPRY